MSSFKPWSRRSGVPGTCGEQKGALGASIFNTLADQYFSIMSMCQSVMVPTQCELYLHSIAFLARIWSKTEGQ